jgi:uncharacterized membrane protein
MTKKQTESKAKEELKSSLEFEKTVTDRFAVFIAKLLGSIGFLIGCIIFFILWIGLNLGATPIFKPFDPFPFPILEMMVSIFAIILSVSVLINQNRQSRIEKTRQQVDFEVNVRAENEITKILNMLHEIHQKMGLHSEEDLELEKMKKTTDVKEIHKSLDNKTD